jgi:hypothetical protein
MDFIGLFLLGFTSQQQYTGHMATFHRYWWRKTEAAP